MTFPTQKVITYSYSSQKTVQENVFCFYGAILNLVTKVVQTPPKSVFFSFFNMQTGQFHPYVHFRCFERFFFLLFFCDKNKKCIKVLLFYIQSVSPRWKLCDFFLNKCELIAAKPVEIVQISQLFLRN